MRRQLVIRAALGVGLLLGLAAACGDARRPGGTAPAGMATVASSSGSGGNGGEGPGSAGAPATVEDTACEPFGGSSVTVYEAAAALAPVERVGRVGARLVAQTSYGAYLMDADGQHASPSPIVVDAALHRAVAATDSVTVAGLGDRALRAQRFDADGVDIDATKIVTADVPRDLALASDGTSTLFAWGVAGKIRARLLEEETYTGPAFAVTSGAYTQALSLDATHRDGVWAIAYAGVPNGSDAYALRVSLLDRDGPLGEPVAVADGAERQDVRQLVATDTGYALLVAGPPPENRPRLVALDAQGAPTSPLRDLAGARAALGVASLGARVGVMAQRDDGALAFRPFDATAAPAGPWVCLSNDTTEPASAAIVATDGGFAVLHSASAGAVVLSRFDADGTGAP